MESVKLHFKKQGSGPALYILHGLLGSLDNWQTVANSLTDEFTVFLVDLRNHGRSPHTQDMNYPLMAADVLQLIEEQSTEPVFILGHSMGGKVVMQCLAENSDLFRKAIIADIGPKKYAGGHESILQAMSSMDLSQLAKRSDADELLKISIPDFGTRQFILKNLDRASENGFQWKCNLTAIIANYPKIMDKIKFENPVATPVLFLSGGNSNYISLDDHNSIRYMFSKAQFQSITDAGHWVHAEKTKETIEAIKKYFG
ncbi:MAG: alpha/beta fold hydrolase [Saprospiraceae bacterium]|nr:alpha/beta fold hydrolase [Saprospiraceae bacterium]